MRVIDDPIARQQSLQAAIQIRGLQEGMPFTATDIVEDSKVLYEFLKAVDTDAS